MTWSALTLATWRLVLAENAKLMPRIRANDRMPSVSRSAEPFSSFLPVFFIALPRIELKENNLGETVGCLHITLVLIMVAVNLHLEFDNFWTRRSIALRAIGC